MQLITSVKRSPNSPPVAMIKKCDQAYFRWQFSHLLTHFSKESTCHVRYHGLEEPEKKPPRHPWTTPHKTIASSKSLLHRLLLFLKIWSPTLYACCSCVCVCVWAAIGNSFPFWVSFWVFEGGWGVGMFLPSAFAMVKVSPLSKVESWLCMNEQDDDLVCVCPEWNTRSNRL